MSTVQPSTLRSMLLRIGLACVLLVTSPELTLACECGWPAVETAYDEATAVFTATAIERESPFGAYSDGASMAVDRVWKGEVPRMIFLVAGEFESSDGIFISDSCEWLPQDGDRYLIFATERDDYYETWTCSGTSAWKKDQAPELFEALVEAHGEGSPPNASLLSHVAPPTSDPPYSVPTNTVPAYAAPKGLDGSRRSSGLQFGITAWVLVVLLASLLGLMGVAALGKRDAT